MLRHYYSEAQILSWRNSHRFDTPCFSTHWGHCLEMTRFIQTTTSCVGVGSSVLLSLRPPCVTTIVLCFSFIRSCRHFDSASVWCILALALMLTALIFYNKYKKIANKQVELHNHVGVTSEAWILDKEPRQILDQPNKKNKKQKIISWCQVAPQQISQGGKVYLFLSQQLALSPCLISSSLIF